MVTVEFLSAVKMSLSEFVLEREKLLPGKNFGVHKDKHLPSKQKRKNLYIQETEKLRKILAEIRNTMFYTNVTKTSFPFRQQITRFF